jgi:hypothetical protein
MESPFRTPDHELSRRPFAEIMAEAAEEERRFALERLQARLAIRQMNLVDPRRSAAAALVVLCAAIALMMAVASGYQGTSDQEEPTVSRSR